MKSFEQKINELYPPLEPNQSSYSELSVAVVLAPSFTITPIAGFLDVLRLAADEADFSRQIFCQWTILGEQKGQKVMSSSGVELTTWQTYDEPDNYHYVIVVGGRLPYSFELSQAGYDFIAKTYQKKVKIIALCVGSFLLAKLGLLDYRQCAVGFGHEREMNILFPKVKTYTDRLYMEDGNIITCPGGVSAIDLANELITHHCGKARSIKTMRSMLVGHNRKPAEIPSLHYEHAEQFGDWQTRRAIQYMENHLGEPMSIESLAKEIGINQTSLTQSFKQFLNITPMQFWKRIRMEHAQWLLLNTNKLIATISDECGFFDAAHFSKSYKQCFGVSPKQTRQVNKRILKVSAEYLSDTVTEHKKITRFYNHNGIEDI